MDFEHLHRRFEQARANRGNFESTWQQIAERVLPQMADFNIQRSQGDKRTELMFDATAALAAQKAVAAISAFVWPGNQRYQKLATSDKSLNKNHRVKLYLDSLTDALFEARYSPRAAFEAQMGEAGLQYVVFGTGLTFIDDNIRGQALRYKALHLGQTFVLENAGGTVDTVYRCWKWTLRQIDQRWPGKLPAKLQERLVKHPDEEHEVMHAVYPRDDHDPQRMGYMGWPWASCYCLPGEKHMVDEGGYQEWPFSTMRYMTSPGEVYGRSPAWLALSNIRVLNTMKRTTLAAAQKVADPPLLASEDGILGAFSQAPGALNFGGLSPSGEQLVKPLITGADVRLSLEMMDKEREIISGAFFLDVFRALVENPQMTATQALELLNERAIQMAPMVGRIESEGLGPMTEREIALLHRAGQLPDMPPELIEAAGEYRIEYTSPARKAMRASEAIAITRTFEAVLPLAEQDPSIMDTFDLDAAVREIADIQGVPAKILRDVEQVKEMREGRKQQQELAQAVEAAPALSSAAANLTKMQANGGMATL
jgi:hypothetical protein